MEETRRSGVPGERRRPQRPGRCGPGGRSGGADSLPPRARPRLMCLLGVWLRGVVIGSVTLCRLGVAMGGCGFWGCGRGCGC